MVTDISIFRHNFKTRWTEWSFCQC